MKIRAIVEAAVIAAVIAMACYFSSHRRYLIPAEYPPDFDPQVQSFMAQAKAQHVSVDLSSLTIRETDMFNDTPVLGVCIPDQHTVLINSQFWAKADAAEREFLVFHELGHCVLGREHSTWMHDGFPVSMMFPIEWETGREDYYYMHRDQLITELFHPFQGKLYEINLKHPSGVIYPLTLRTR